MALEAGDTLSLYVNQGEREAVVLAVIGGEALVEYEMPNGTTALWVTDHAGAKLRNAAYNRLALKWLKAIVAAETVWIGRPQQAGRHNFLPSPARMLSKRLESR